MLLDILKAFAFKIVVFVIHPSPSVQEQEVNI